MFFNSLAFALFLPTVVGLFWGFPRRWRVPLLLVASYVFYGWWDVRFLGLIMISTVVDWFVAKQLSVMPDGTRRRWWLMLSLVGNLGMLAFFKYWNFFTDSAARLLTTVGLEPNLPLLRIILPVGISFYTFQTLSYVIDVYRRDLEPESSLSPVRPVRLVLPAARGRSDRTGEAPAAAAEELADVDASDRLGWIGNPHPARFVPEGRDRRWRCAAGERGVCHPRQIREHHGGGGCHRLLAPDLWRLRRIHRYRPGHRSLSSTST